MAICAARLGANGPMTLLRAGEVDGLGIGSAIVVPPGSIIGQVPFELDLPTISKPVHQ